VEIDVITINNKVCAYFNNGMNSLKDFYHIEVGTLVHFKYVGQGTFKIRFSITPIGVPRPPLETTSRIQKGTKRMLWESNIFDEQLPIWKKMVSYNIYNICFCYLIVFFFSLF